ncbi:DUF6879 family protein [Streptomyces sp. NBC_01367]|uniref:DUF6879 family protein n=1 Tax=Streptomyces sp. NBC_01367 TaxID=2903841 RepID=UPI00386F18BB
MPRWRPAGGAWWWSARESSGFAGWLATGRRNTDSDSGYWVFWTGLVRRTTARGVSVRRVRIVSDYSCYSHAGRW